MFSSKHTSFPEKSLAHRLAQAALGNALGLGRKSWSGGARQQHARSMQSTKARVCPQSPQRRAVSEQLEEILRPLRLAHAGGLHWRSA